MSNMDFAILCVDDEPDIVEETATVIESLGYRALTASCSEEAIEAILAHGHETIMVLCDFKMPNGDGINLRRWMLDKKKSIPFAIISGHVTREMALQGVELKIAAFIEKPFDESELKEIVGRESAERIEALTEEAELKSGFIEEAEPLLEEMEELMLGLEEHPDDAESINRIFAIVHTIKGVSGFFEPDVVNQFSHRFEDFLTLTKNGEMEINAQVVSVYLKSLDVFKVLMGVLKDPKAEVPLLKDLLPVLEISQDDVQKGDLTQKVPPPSTKSTKREDVKVPTQLLDEFMEMSGEITVLRNMIIKTVRQIEKDVPGNKDIVHLSDFLDEMHKVNSSIQNKIVDMRKVSLKSVFRPLTRAVRDLNQKLNKAVALSYDGDGLRVDTSIAQVLSGSMIHMVRNCMDHAIEDDPTRESLGKPPGGRIDIRCREESDQVTVEIRDDGKGIDADFVAKRAQEKELRTAEELSLMSQSEILGLIFEAGFSTAQTVTDVSGRGVGTDMVKGSVEKIGGRIDVSSEVHVGTRFELQLPVPKSVTIANSLFIETGEQVFSIPEDFVDRLICLDEEAAQDQVQDLEGSRVIRLENELVPLVDLREILKMPKVPSASDLNIVVVSASSRKFGICVETILDVEDTVIRSLDASLAGLAIFSGATFLGEGLLGLVLNIEEMARTVGQPAAENLPEVEEPSSQVESVDFGLTRDFLMFTLPANGLFSVAMRDVFRLEEVSVNKVQYVGDQPVVIYRDQTMPILDLVDHMGVHRTATSDSAENWVLLVGKSGDRPIAFRIKEIIDLVRSAVEPMESVTNSRGVKGNLILNGKNTVLVDIPKILSELSGLKTDEGQDTDLPIAMSS